MTKGIRRLVSAVMERLRGRRPSGHMAMLRDIVDRREADRVAQAASTDERQARERASRAAEQ